MRLRYIPFSLLLIGVLLPISCGDDSNPPATASETWSVGTALPSLRQRDADGFLDLRGIIHVHSYFSHDACDDMPVVDGVRNEPCFQDLRRGMCQTRHDFMMFTDHPADFREAEFEAGLLFRPAHNDVLVERSGQAVAAWAGCPDVDPVLVLAGSESSRVMPVGLEGHVADTPEERSAVYGSDRPEDAARLRAQGAVILLAHPEMYTVDELAARDIDGFEMYNLHANLLRRDSLAAALRLLQRLNNGDPGLPHPDLALLPIVVEDERYLERWGTVLARGLRRVTTMGTDAHRNTLPTLMQDGERVDSYRRMLLWFSNHLLVEPESDGSWDDRHLKDALRDGRLYGAFEMFGYPENFAFFADIGGRREPMGAEVNLTAGPILRVHAPRVRGLDPALEAPQMTTRLLRAVEGGFEEVARGGDVLEYAPSQPGAYRAEVRIVPLHLRADLGSDADEYLARDFVWIYANPIYIE